jgi:hypothetical protein
MRCNRHRRWALATASGLSGRRDGPLEPAYQATTTDGGGSQGGAWVG